MLCLFFHIDAIIINNIHQLDLMIQKAKPGDFEEVFVLLKQLYTKERFIRKKIHALYLNSLRKKDSIELVMKKDNKIIGYAAVKFRDDIQIQAKAGYLSELIINESQRGKGFGTKLLKEIIKKSKKLGCKEIQFPSTFKRKKAHKFYETLGFKTTAYFFWKEI